MTSNWIFGIVVVISYLFSSFLVWRGARKLGLSEEKVIDLILLAIIFSLVGGRLIFVFTQWSSFSVSPIRTLLIFKYPGLSISGAVASGIISLGVLSYLRKFSIALMYDLFSLPILLSSLLILFSCQWIGCSALVNSRLSWGLVTLIVFIATLSRLQKYLTDSPRTSKIKHRHGVIFILSLIIAQTLSLLLAKTLSGGLYSIYKFLFGVEVLALAFYFKDYFTMIRIPASVLTQIKDYLESKLHNTEKRMSELKRDDPVSNKDRLHEEFSDDDVATNKASHEKTQAIQLQLTKSVVEIRKALSKIKVGSYGICEVCGKMIDTDRLAANPSATLCLEDEKKKEKSKR